MPRKGILKKPRHLQLRPTPRKQSTEITEKIGGKLPVHRACRLAPAHGGCTRTWHVCPQSAPSNTWSLYRRQNTGMVLSDIFSPRTVPTHQIRCSFYGSDLCIWGLKPVGRKNTGNGCLGTLWASRRWQLFLITSEALSLQKLCFIKDKVKWQQTKWQRKIQGTTFHETIYNIGVVHVRTKWVENAPKWQ